LFASSTKENKIEKSLWAFKITILVDDEKQLLKCHKTNCSGCKENKELMLHIPAKAEFAVWLCYF
jgi:hypothetical protein